MMRSRGPGGRPQPGSRTRRHDDPVYDDPGTACIVPSVTAVIRGQDGGILLVRKPDNNLWALPGGARRAFRCAGGDSGRREDVFRGPRPGGDYLLRDRRRILATNGSGVQREVGFGG